MSLYLLHLCVKRAVDNDRGNIPKKKLLKTYEDDNDNEESGSRRASWITWKGKDKRSLKPEDKSEEGAEDDANDARAGGSQGSSKKKRETW